jgi:hypothetical protein
VARLCFRRAASAGVAVALAAAAFAAEDKVPRRELAPFEQALADAVGRVSSPASTETCRGYRLPGFGALFVVSTRIVPQRIAMKTLNALESNTQRIDRDLGRSIANLEDSLKTAATDKEKQDLSANVARLKEQQRMLRQRAAAERQLEQQITAFEAEVERMHQEAVRNQREAEEAMRQMMDRVSPGHPGGRELASRSVSAHALPPWVNWIRAPADESRTPEQVMADVREALFIVLEQHGSLIESLEPDEVVAVAVDFVAVGSASPAPSRTLVVRAPKSTLDALRAGRLASEDARKQFQIAEY